MGPGEPRSVSAFRRTLLLVLLPFGAAYFLSGFYRSINAVIAPELVRTFALGPAELGLLTATYFLTFGLFQLPMGVLLDRFGARRVQACLVATCALGSVVFALGDSVATLAIGRGLIGLGLAGGLMAAFKVMAVWLPRQVLPMANGCFMVFGGLGILSATRPAQAALDVMPWSGIFLAMAAVAASIAAAIWLVVPEQAEEAAARPTRIADLAQGVARIYGDRQFWRYAPVNVVFFAVGSALQTLWAAPWLRDVAGYGRADIGNVLMAMAVAFAAGAVLGGLTAEAMRRRGLHEDWTVGGAAVLCMLAHAGLLLEIPWLVPVCWVAMSLTYIVVSLSYATLTNWFAPALAGRVNGCMNTLVVTGTFLCQYAIGGAIGLFPATATGYAPDAYRVTFAVLIVLEIATFAWFLLGRPRGQGSST